MPDAGSGFQQAHLTSGGDRYSGEGDQFMIYSIPPLLLILIDQTRMRRRPYEIDLSFESFNEVVYRDGSSFSGSTATFPNPSQLSLSIGINYHDSSLEES
jgi:hypothetical protein